MIQHKQQIGIILEEWPGSIDTYRQLILLILEQPNLLSFESAALFNK